MDPQTRVRRAPRTAARRLADGTGAVVLNLATAGYHGFNATAELIWDHIEGEVEFSALVESVAQALDEVPDSLAADMADFVSSLHERGLVELVPPGPTAADD